MSSTKEQHFLKLSQEASACQLCPDLTDRQAVLSHLNGSLHPRVLFIAEAPGRKGADRTRIPLYGDASAIAFEALLESIHLLRSDIFITNAAMCNPHTATGANRPPTQTELKNCSSFLLRTIELLDAPLLVTLGTKALAAISLLEKHTFTLATHAATPCNWMNRTLIPVYHPSPQVTISTRTLAQQKHDWLAIREFLERSTE